MARYPIYHAKGNYSDIGLFLGRQVKYRLEENIDYYIKRLEEIEGLDHSRLEKEAIPWLRSLPPEYQVELENLAQGAGCSLMKVARWLYSDMCIAGGCTSFIHETPEGVWIGRNNDYLIPGIWGYITVIAVRGKIPIMLFGLEAGIFSGTGYNKEKLWVHYNWLPDTPNPEGLPPFVFHRQVLENCSSVGEVEALLKENPRDGGMSLFVLDGKKEEYAVFECSGKKHRKKEPEEGIIAAANHFHFPDIAPRNYEVSADSRGREEKTIELLLKEKDTAKPSSYINILGNSGVEARGQDSGTVYSCVVCPKNDLVYYSADPFPAASRGVWEKIAWEW